MSSAPVLVAFEGLRFWKIPLSQGKFALIDEEIRPLIVSSYAWYAQHHRNTYYARCHLPTQPDGSRPVLSMHNLIGFHLGITAVVDHKNGDGLDNRGCNLRAAPHGLNAANRCKLQTYQTSSRFKGVCRFRSKWRAYIQDGGKLKHLGLFTEEVEAARAYDVAAFATWGEFARPNLPTSVLIKTKIAVRRNVGSS